MEHAYDDDKEKTVVGDNGFSDNDSHASISALVAEGEIQICFADELRHLEQWLTRRRFDVCVLLGIAVLRSILTQPKA